MKKTTLLLLLVGGAAFAQYTAIPDPNFEQALIDLGYDDVIDGQVLTANIENVIELDVYDKNIDDMTGLQGFTSLETLMAGGNNYTTINLNQNTALISLNLLGIQPLTELDVSQNVNLIDLMFACPAITSVDVSNNPNLKSFYSRGSESNLTSVDFTNNPLLESLRIRSNNISELDLSNNNLLTIVECDGNPLTSLTVSNMPNLIYLFCAATLITSMDVSQNPNLAWADFSVTQLTSIDLSQNTMLTSLWCNRVPNLESIDVRNGNNLFLNLEARENPNLTCIYVDDKNNVPIWAVDENASYVETEEECNALSVGEFEAITFDLYPNPTKDFFIINSKSAVETVSIYNVSGKLIKTFAAQNEYDVSGLSKGLYLLKIKSEAGNSVEKLIVN